MIEIVSLPHLRGLTQSATRLTVVDFFADWCGPCQRAKPIYHQLAQTFSKSHPDKVQFCVCNSDQQRDCAREHRVTGLPTFAIFHAGKELWRDHSVEALNRVLTDHLVHNRPIPQPPAPVMGNGGGLSSSFLLLFFFFWLCYSLLFKG